VNEKERLTVFKKTLEGLQAKVSKINQEIISNYQQIMNSEKKVDRYLDRATITLRNIKRSENTAKTYGKNCQKPGQEEFAVRLNALKDIELAGIDTNFKKFLVESSSYSSTKYNVDLKRMQNTPDDDSYPSPS
jgi:vacuolar-type H+-ATPase subunit D/Vma8